MTLIKEANTLGLRSGDRALVVSWGCTRSETALHIALILRSIALRLGWGWDAELPLRPWPAVQVHSVGRHPDWCIACCGFYVGLTKRTMEPKP